MKQRLTSILGKRRWDSSDPERAPPPLPLNPGTTSPVSRPNTSARIEEAAALITAKAREHASSHFNSKAMPESSPEKSLIKGHHHKRMQSIQSGTVRDLSSSLERRSPEKGLGRDSSLRAAKVSDYERSPERSPTREREETPTPSGRDTPTKAYLSKPILGENTPPSATMLALQNMRSQSEREVPLSNVTNQNAALVRQPQAFEGISSQILSLTSICTNLQHEMVQLTRRSKDNATDLLSLKEATNSRDEDIRKSLKELVVNVSTKMLDHADASRSTPNLGSYLLDDKAHTTPTGRKTIALPRIPSPASFAASIERDREFAGTPSVVNSDGAASIALLEKVLREMGTKEGQDKIIKALDQVASKAPKAEQISWDPSLYRKLDDILKFLKSESNSQALVRATGGGGGGVSFQAEKDFESPRSGPLTRVGKEVTPTDRRTSGASSSTVVNEEMMTMLKRIKGSVAEGGGLTNEVKALVRELRGEVLGMGREIARKLEQAESSEISTTRHDAHGPGREEIAHIVETGLSQLKEHMGRFVQDQRRVSNPVRSAFDAQEIYHAVKNAVKESMTQDGGSKSSALEKEEILTAVREAWEDCKPEIELQGFGLEREDILDCLKEGLKSYHLESSVREVGASYDEVLEAVQKGLRDFRPPTIEPPSAITREEILMTVRECLETFDFPAMQAPVSREMDLTRDDVVDAVKEGLLAQVPVTKEIEFNRDDLFDAVRAGLEGAPTPMGGVGERVLEQMHDFITSMKTEFKQYSAANGKDTEQVLDAMKDGLEELRAEIESYVDRAQDVTGKDEIIDTVKDGFRTLQADLERNMANMPQARAIDTPELLDAMEKEFEHLRQTLNKGIVPTGGSNDKEEILDAIRDMSESDRGSSLTIDTSNVAAMVKEELEHMRETLATMLVRPSNSVDRDEILEAVREGFDAHYLSRKADGGESILSNTSELLDAFQEGVDNIRVDMQKMANRPADLSSGLEILDEIKEGIRNVRNDIEHLHTNQRQVAEVSAAREADLMTSDGNLISSEIEGLKIMITQLRIKVEALDSFPNPQGVHDSGISRDDLADIANTLKEVHVSVNEFGTKERSMDGNVASKDDTDAIETLLRNAKAQLDALDPESLAKFEHIEALDDLLRDVKETVDAHKESAFLKEDVLGVEGLLREVANGIDDLQAKIAFQQSEDDRVTKEDIQAIQSLCMDTKDQIEELQLPDPNMLPTKIDIDGLHDKLRGLQEQIEADNELTAQAFDARKTEHGGLATKIDDTKAFMVDLREELLKKLDGSDDGIVELAKTLESYNETFGTFATADSMMEVIEMLRENFDKAHSAHDSTKLETEERDAALMVKHEETKAALSKEISNKLENKFNEIMEKYDDAQLASEASRGEHTAATTSTKAVAEDLKILLNTLGTTMTEACERMGDDAKTVFTRVDETHSKVDELRENSQSEHNITRDEIAKTVLAAERLEAQLNEQHPAILDAIKDIAILVGQHYEHSQKTSEEMKTGISGIPSAIPPLLPALPQPAPMSPIEIPAQKEYDDSQVHDKLNTLINHATAAKESLTQMEKLDTIHQQVIATAGEISAMVATQSRLMAEHHNNKFQEAQEAGIALEKRTAQKEQVEGDIVRLSQEREELAQSVNALKTEQEMLIGQSKRFAREVGVLETALNLRQEEMKVMERRAESLEKKILEGVMDHARSMMINRPVKNPRTARAADRDAAMSLKRVSSAASTLTKASTVRESAAPSTTFSTLSSAVGLALKRRAPLQEGGNSTVQANSPSSKGRRILSTSYVTPRPSLNADQRAMMIAPVSISQPKGGLMNLKRSHSVKSNPSSYYGNRKASWAGHRNSSVVDKENESFREEDEELDRNQGTDDDDDAGTERRSSFNGTVVDSDLYTVSDSMAYGTGSSVSGTTGSRLSYASSTRGEIAGQMGQGGQYIGAEVESEATDDAKSVVGSDDHHTPMTDGPNDLPDGKDEQPEQSEEETQIMALLDPASASVTGEDQDNTVSAMVLSGEAADQLGDLEAPPKMTDLVMWNQPSDSGIGSEIPTAALEHVGEYFESGEQDRGV